MLTKRKFLGLLAIVAISIVFVTTVTSSGFINVRDPETAKGPVIVPPLLAPPGQAGYISQQTGSVITAPDGRPVAQLAAPPVDLAQGIAVNLPNSNPMQNAATVSYAILASVRYTGNGHIVLVTTARPSLAAAQQPSVLGDQTVKLDDGSTAWGATGIPGDTPNQLVLVRGDLIITIAGDLPINSLKVLAAQVVIK